MGLSHCVLNLRFSPVHFIMQIEMCPPKFHLPCEAKPRDEKRASLKHKTTSLRKNRTEIGEVGLHMTHQNLDYVDLRAQGFPCLVDQEPKISCERRMNAFDTAWRYLSTRIKVPLNFYHVPCRNNIIKFLAIASNDLHEQKLNGSLMPLCKSCCPLDCSIHNRFPNHCVWYHFFL